MITGVPRSGTSLLGRVLDQHPQISTWVEPYYIWDYHFRDAPHDQLTADDATDKVRQWIRKAYAKYRIKLNANIVIDKSPRICLKIPFVHEVFPEARYIIILRDGRDTILSMYRQWEKKEEIFGNTSQRSQWQDRWYVFKRWLRRRPTWQFRLQSVLFELGSPKNWLQKKFLYKIRWEGRFGWGPRFKGWQEIMANATSLEFSAYQWIHCARGILDNIGFIPESRRLVLKYENFITNPKASIKKILEFLSLELPEGFMAMMPEIWSNNSNKWPQAFTAEELTTIGPIIGKTLIEFGYEKDENWYPQN